MFPFLAPLSKAFARMTTAELDDVWRHIQQLTPGEDELMAAQLTSGPSAGDVAQPGAPTVTGSYITNGGATLTVVFSEPVTGSTGFIVAGTALTYASGSGSSQLVYTLSPPVPANATTYLSYGNTPGNVTDTTGTALAGFSGMPITNNGTSPPPLPVANRYAWKRRSFDVDGKRIDHPDGMTGSSTWMPAYEPNNKTLASGTEVWLRRKLTTASAGVMFEIVGAGGGGDTVEIIEPFDFGVTPPVGMKAGRVVTLNLSASPPVFVPTSQFLFYKDANT